jgi:murein DD-endopeptidase MepM/ murein hydrolase activator NlpD
VSHVGVCAGCSSDIGLSAARPSIGADGRVALFCGSCAVNGPPRRDEPAAILVAPPEAIEREPRRSRVARVAMPIAGIGVAFAAMLSSAAVTVVERDPVRVTANVPEGIEPERVAVRVIDPGAVGAPMLDDVPAVPRTTTTETLEEVDLDILEEDRPSLRDWVHPVTGTDEKTPARSTRRFGAHRHGASDSGKCGSGHCGLDLAGPRGRPVVAVAWGTVVRVEHSASGRDGKSGRYVRVEHPEGVFTSYMHLDAIEAEIRVGDEVVAGQVLGTLGKTGIHSAEQHLHFGLEIEVAGKLSYIDPTPFLQRAEVVPVPAPDEIRLTPEERSNW